MRIGAIVVIIIAGIKYYQLSGRWQYGASII